MGPRSVGPALYFIPTSNNTAQDGRWFASCTRRTARLRERARASSVKRAIAIYGDKVYTGTSDVHVVALDAKTGRVVWDKPIADRKAGYGLTGGVTIAKGKVIAGTTGRGPGGNFIVALDANTGQEAWRWNTIPKENEPGGNTWNGALLA